MGSWLTGLVRDVGGVMGDVVLEREWSAPSRLDVRVTLSVQGRGRGDPTFRADAGAIWRTSLTPDGPGTIRVLPVAVRDAARGDDSAPAPCPGAHQPDVRSPGWEPAGCAGPGTCTRVRAQAWGPGAGWLLDALPAALGLDDDISGFDPGGHPLIRDAARRHLGFRLGRSGRLMEALVPAILEQKVVVLEAHRAWKILLMNFGTLPPGPAPPGMRVFPPPRVWRRIPSWEWHRSGAEGVRAETIIRAASVAETLERLLTTTHEEADRRLRTIPGIGIWTSAEARQRAAGDPDAVSVGDYHLSNVVGWFLAGRDRTDDAGMLELLAPYKGHRHRVTRLISLSRGNGTGAAGGGQGAQARNDGHARYGGGPQRRGPRMPIRDYRSF